ncbi:MAG: hypothetical protein ACFE8J_18405 [Candidatus Heimdallarchaeota archaeon]
MISHKEILSAIKHGYGLDHEWAVLKSIIGKCGLKFERYLEDSSILTKEILESHFNDILKEAKKDGLEYLVLGALIIETGSILPEQIKNRILEISNIDFEKKWRWQWFEEKDKQIYSKRTLESRRKFLKERDALLKTYHNMIQNYQSEK